MNLTGLPVDEQTDGHAPQTLPGDAPVRTVTYHALDTLLAPGWNPANLPDGFQRLFAQVVLVHGNEPLPGSAVKERGLVAPTMGVAVGVGLSGQQGLMFLQQLQQDGLRLVQRKTGEPPQLLDKATIRQHQLAGLKAVALAQGKVLLAMGRGGVHDASAHLQGDMLASQDGHGTVHEGMPCLQAHQPLPSGTTQDGRLGGTHGLEHGRTECLGHDQQPGLSLLLASHQDVVEVWTDGQGLVGRQCPWRGGPDDPKRCSFLGSRTKNPSKPLGLHGCKARIDGRGATIHVFHLGFRQSGATA